jgi:peptide/nickel transport system permease protein
MRGTIVSVLENDYIAFGTAKGLHPRHLFFAYGMRNSLLPQLTGLAGSLGSIVSGVLLVEIVFTYPGLGFLIRLALTSKDYALVAGIGFVILALLAVFLFVLDLALPLLDQRLKNRGNW